MRPTRGIRGRRGKRGKTWPGRDTHSGHHRLHQQPGQPGAQARASRRRTSTAAAAPARAATGIGDGTGRSRHRRDDLVDPVGLGHGRGRRRMCRPSGGRGGTRRRGQPRRSRHGETENGHGRRGGGNRRLSGPAQSPYRIHPRPDGRRARQRVTQGAPGSGEERLHRATAQAHPPGHLTHVETLGPQPQGLRSGELTALPSDVRHRSVWRERDARARHGSGRLRSPLGRPLGTGRAAPRSGGRAPLACGLLCGRGRPR